jgi:hypothetical protein
MGKIVVFGDSFVHNAGIKDAWINQVANHYGHILVNFAEAGSSIHHAVLRLMEYLSSPVYQPDDWFLYVITSTRRSPWAPPPASAVMTKYFAGNLKKTDRSYAHYAENEDFYSGYLNLYRPDLEHYQQLGILSLLHNLPNRKIVFTGWPLTSELNAKSQAAVAQVFGPTLFESSANTVFVKSSLYNISMSEVPPARARAVERTGWNDYRVNHFSPLNHQVLAAQTIHSLDSMKDCIDPIKFHINIHNP